MCIFSSQIIVQHLSIKRVKVQNLVKWTMQGMAENPFWIASDLKKSEEDLLDIPSYSKPLGEAILYRTHTLESKWHHFSPSKTGTAMVVPAVPLPPALKLHTLIFMTSCQIWCEMFSGSIFMNWSPLFIVLTTTSQWYQNPPTFVLLFWETFVKNKLSSSQSLATIL